MLITVIGRGHSGTRAISHTLSLSGVYMGQPLNGSWDLLPPQDLYEACRVMAKYVTWKGGLEWDFSRVLSMEPDPAFRRLVESYLSDVLSSKAENRGWKLPETTLIYPWIVKLFPDIRYIHWVRDPRDCILSGHLTDDLRDFGVEYPHTGQVRHDRAVSWYYQREIVRATPAPAHWISVRFEDMVLRQEETLRRLEAFLGLPMARLEMNPQAVGRYKTDDDIHMYDFFLRDIRECGYDLD